MVPRSEKKCHGENWRPNCVLGDRSISTSSQVTFNDTAKTSGLAAVELDERSSYKAEETSFVGEYGKVRIFLDCLG